LNDDKFLMMFEVMYGNNENQLAQKLLDYDYCNYQGAILLFILVIVKTHFIEGTDECDRIAKVHKCGVEKDPDLVSNMMQVADVSTPVV
jgi:hypothetical protein